MKYNAKDNERWQFDNEEIATIMRALDKARAEPYYGEEADAPPNEYESLFQNISLVFAAARANCVNRYFDGMLTAIPYRGEVISAGSCGTMTWEEYQKEYGFFDCDSYEPTNIACPKCNKPLYRYTKTVLTSYPPQYWYECKSCGWSEVGR